MTNLPRYIERLCIGGGYGDPKNGGMNIESNGDLTTDGDILLRGVIAAGDPPQTLTNPQGELNGARIQTGTVRASQLDPNDAYTLGSLYLKGTLRADGGFTGHNRAAGVSTEDLVFLCHFESTKTVNTSVVADTFLDWSGNNQHLKVYTQGNTCAGKYGRGVQFQGTGGFARTAGTQLAETYGGGALTFSAWVKTTTYATDPQVIIGFVGDAPYYPYARLAIVSGKAQVRLRGNSSTPAMIVEGTTRIDDGLWHHLVGVIPAWNTAGTVSVYVDGALDGSGVDTRTATSACASYFYVASANGAAQFFSGILDETAVWKRALTADEVRAFYLLSTELVPTFQNQVIAGGLSVLGGTIESGIAGSQRGVIAVVQGSGTTAPGCIRLHSFDGSAWYLFVENDGTLRVCNALPTASGQGQIVAHQG